jgi:hypothetical protein
MSIVELREDDPELAVDSEVGAGRKGKRTEYRCGACGYGIVVYERPRGCPMCSEARWEHVGWRPFSQLLDDLPFGTQSQRRRLDVPSSPTAAEPIRSLSPSQAGAALER